MRHIVHAGLLVSFVLSCATPAHGAGDPKQLDAGPPASSPPRQKGADTEVDKYCTNVAVNIALARNIRLEKQIKDAEAKLKDRRDEMEAKRQELLQWVEKAESMLRKADDGIVELYTKMKPEVAAAQLGGLDDDVAAAILMRMKSKTSSAILNEMDASRGAVLVKRLVTLSSLPRSGKTQ